MIYFLATATLCFSALTASPKPLSWQVDYGKALSAARSLHRPLLVVLDVPTDPKASAKNKLAVEARAELLSAYQRCHIDVTTEYGKKVAKSFGATQFPFTVIIDKTGSAILYKKLGQLSDHEWNETLVAYQKGERAGILHTTFFRGDGTLDLKGANTAPDASEGSLDRSSGNETESTYKKEMAGENAEVAGESKGVSGDSDN